ncbi:hypothetical protein ACH4U3_43220 [Streptomyces griseoruber]|uniref:hypothetical protein n=1 Tax=Streptomyces griseoruber TaxID=1943 RepID=UPI00378F7E35
MPQRPPHRLRRRRGPYRSRRLRERGTRRHQVVDQHHRPTAQQPPAPAHHRQRAHQVLLPLTRVQPGLIGHRPALPQHRGHPHPNPGPPQLTGRGQRDTAGGVVAAGAGGGGG